MAIAILSSGAVHAQAQSSYGPPYSYNTAYGTEGGFLTVDAAVNSLMAAYANACSTYLSCVPHTFPTTYSSGFNAATILIATQDSDGTTETSLLGYIEASDTWGVGFAPKNAGGCAAMCTGGLGKPNALMGPRGSSGEGTTKSAGENRGTSLEGDPINVANGNAYRQDTDIASSGWLTLRRFYNASSYVVATTMGPKWRHSFDRSLQLMPQSGANNGLLYARRPDGSLIRFMSTKGLWKADADSADILTTSTDPATGVVTAYALRVAATRETEHYDGSGRLQTISDDNGWVTTLTYSDASTSPATAPSAGLLIAVTDPQGRVLNFKYDAKARLTQVIDPAGKTVNYAYADSGNLASVTFADGTSRQYVYSESAYSAAPAAFPSELTGVIDEKGIRFETTAFNSTNHAISNQFAGGADKITLDYYNIVQNGGVPAEMTTPLGLSVMLTYADDGSQTLKPSGTDVPCGSQCNQAFGSVTYDADGNPASSTDHKGHLTTTTYDANGLLTHQVEASGTDAQRNTSLTWDTVHRVPLTQATSNAKSILLSKNTWTYNARGQATAECAIDPSVTVNYACGAQAHAPKGVRQTLYTYCDTVNTTQCPKVGLLLTVDGPRTDVTDVMLYSYYLTTDESGCATVGGICHRAGDLFQTTDAAGHVTSVLAYDRNGRPARRKDPNGVITDVTYTQRGWLASRTVRANASGAASTSDATTTLTYDPVGALKSITDPDGLSLTYTYDAAHRLIDVADAQANHVHYTLDASGNRTKEETFDAKGALRRTLSRKFNTLGQLTSITDGLGHVVFDATASGSYDADGNLVSSKDSQGIARSETYDALDRLVTDVANANGSDTATQNTTTVFTFDALDQLKSVTDPEGLITTYAFDGLSNATGQTSPDTGTQSATFDAAGNAVTHTDAKGTVVNQAFDALGRVVSASYADSKLNIAYHYDEANSVTGCASSLPLGHLTRVVQTTLSTSYCYDNQGRVIEQRQTQGTVTDITDYVYTKAGRLSATASPTGLVTEYGRDALGQVVTVTSTPVKGVATKIVTAATYLPFGPVAAYTLGNGQTVTRTYDANYQVNDVTSPALSLHVARDAAGNIVALGDAAGARPATESYTYDPLYRLTAVKDATGKAVEAYTYNHTGDRLSKVAPGSSTGAYGYKAGTHWLTTIGTASRTYDANGSTTGNANAGVAWGYGYDGHGDLTVVQESGATVATYAYDAAHQRVAKTVGTATKRFAYDVAGKLLAEEGATNRDYVWMGSIPVAVVDSGAAATFSFVHADGLGTPRAVTNTAGSVVWTWAYKSNPFGEKTPVSTGGYTLNLRFPGQYADGEAGLKYNVNRSFDAAAGRYIQSDLIGLQGGINTYAYVGGNPLSYIDPLGLTPHHYTVTNFICSVAQPGCTSQNVFDRLRQYPAPFSDPSHPINNGDVEDIPVLGHVVHSVDPSNCSITNTTLPDHLLNPGQVTRSVVNDNGMISIVTDGTGDGALAGPNDWLAYPVWSTVDGNISAPWIASPPVYADPPISAGLH